MEGSLIPTGGPTPGDQGQLRAYLDHRDSLRTTRLGSGGLEVSSSLTAALDAAVRSLIPPTTDFAVVAVGGYGRGELSLFSDVDLMLLHQMPDPAEDAAALFRPLWDVGLRVGHSVRTVKEAISAARERYDTQTTLLTGRLIVGSQALFDGLMEEITKVTRARPLRGHLVAEERGRRRETPYLLMAPDLKGGRGGLRTLNGIDWERRREMLIGRFSPDSRSDEEAARETLWQIRNALHAVSGRAHDTYSVDLREPVAKWLGLEVFEASRRLVEAMQTVDRLATARWPEVVGETAGAVRRMRRFRVPGRSGRPQVESGRPAAKFDRILETGERGRLGFERLWETGQLSELLPEWGIVRFLPQLAPFHEHPVDVHLWRTVDEMRVLIDEPHYREVAAEVEERRVLLMAAFLHDIGKGHGGDHAEVGARIARSFGERLDLPETTTSLLERAVKHHLILPETATRRDLDDPAVLEDVMATVGDIELLHILYLLAVADSRATGHTVWNEWKATLLRTLFARCASRFEGDGATRFEPGMTRDELAMAVAPARREALRAHLLGMPEAYVRSVSADDVLWHLELAESLTGASILDVRRANAVDEVVVLGQERAGFRRVVAESLAASGIDVLEARLNTRDDGLIVDDFVVRDERTRDPVGTERWEKARAYIEDGLLGLLDTTAKLAARVAAYPEPPAGLVTPTAHVSVDGASGDLVLTIKCSDRIGRLAEILGVMETYGLEIRLAQVESRGIEVVDTFHLGSAPAPADLLELESLISDAITP